MPRLPFLFLIVLLSSHLLRAKTIDVGAAFRFKHPQPAIISAHNGDTVMLHKGIYIVKNLHINKSIVFKGENEPVLDVQMKDFGITITASHVTIEGITIKNSARASMTDYAGIQAMKARHLTLKNNILINTYFGFHLSAIDSSLIENNTLIGSAPDDARSGNGIHLWQCNFVTIRKNKISGHRDGIYFEFARFCHISQNISEKNFRYGLHFMFSDNDTYTNNIFRNNGTGVAVMYTKGIRMEGNIFADNWGSSSYGVLLKDIGNSYITGNTFLNNTTALYLEGSSRIQVVGNTFQNNGWALKLLANCEMDSFIRNKFNGNTFDVSTNGTISLNYFKHNYWDKYTGYDLDRDGVGDIPYRPVSLYASIIEQIPYAVMLLRSFAVDLLDKAEKNIPSLTPDQLKDDSPLMKSPTR
jgi:nitrous oxidase accessory protein